jgi:hypothetical protein
VPRLRQSLTSSGTARLGAYGGGAPAAPIVASTLSGEGSVAIDSMASASSIDELLTAHSLFVGMDAVEARRIMTERGADRSDDYAALLDSLVRSAASSRATSNRLAEE